MKFKRMFIIVLILTILLGNIVIADDEIEELELENDFLQTSSDIIEELEVFSKHVICMERSTGIILYEKDAYTKTPMASTTKILTGIIAIENCDLNEEVKISAKAANTGGSTLGIYANQVMSMENLLYGLLLRSGNDCAVAIAEHIGGSVEGFSIIMNQKAREIGLTNSNFVTPHGLDNDEHYTTAYDLSILTNYALNNDKFLEKVKTKQISIMIGNYSRSLNNTNELLGNVQGVYGVKTGFTGNAGRCLVTACKRENLDIIVVVIGADTKKIRGLDTKNIIDYVFNNYKMINTKDILDDAFIKYKENNKIIVLKTKDKIDYEYTNSSTYVYPIDKNKISKLKISIYTISLVKSPVFAGSKIGKIRVMCENKILYELDIILKNNINKMVWKDYMKTFFADYTKYFKIF